MTRRSIPGGRWRSGPHAPRPHDPEWLRHYRRTGNLREKWVWDEAADGWVPEGQAIRTGPKPVDLDKLSVNDRAEILKRRKEEEEHI